MENPIRKIFDFKKQEFPIVISLFLFFFLVIAVFWLLKPLAKGLFVENYGADVELFAKLGNILVAALAVAVFTLLYNKLQRQRVIYVLCSFFILCFLSLPFALNKPQPVTIWGFYFLSDLVSTFMVAGFWAYLTDISSSDQSKRLFGTIGTGGVLGGWAGIAWFKLLLGRIGMNGILFLSAAIMGAVLVLIFYAESLIRQSGTFRSAETLRLVGKEKAQKESRTSVVLEGARLVMRSKYLAAIVGIMAFYEIASQVMDYQWKKLVDEGVTGVTETQAFMGDVYFYANILAVVVQLFLVSLIMRKLGLVVALLVLPLAAFSTSLAFLAVPTLFVAGFLVISENGLNYSIQQTARETLYVPTTPDEKYKARAFTSMFVQRLAKGFGTVALIWLGTAGVPVRYLSFITITVVIAMALCGIWAGGRFAEKTRSEEAVARVA